MQHWKNYLWAGFLLTTALFLGGADGSGCGGKSVFESMADDDTTEAKIEKARIALDKGEYAVAIETLEEFCGTDFTAPTCDPEIVSLYASGFAGRAGLDLFDLISEAADQPASSSSSFTLFSRHFAEATGQDVTDMLTAVTLLNSIPSQAPRTSDQGLQLAVTATSDLVVALGTLTGGYDPVTGAPKLIPAPTDPTLLATLARITTDANLMGTGLDEAGIADENIAGHIAAIQSRLAGADPVEVVSFLNELQ